MLKKIQKFFTLASNNLASNNSGKQDEDIQHQLQLACTTLLIEMLYADEVVDSQEENKLQEILQTQFQLAQANAVELIEQAKEKKQLATDYYQFTNLLNTHYTQQQKIDLIKNLWEIAYADNVLDKHEEHLLRRLADLLHIPHKSFLQTKHKTMA